MTKAYIPSRSGLFWRDMEVSMQKLYLRLSLATLIVIAFPPAALPGAPPSTKVVFDRNFTVTGPVELEFNTGSGDIRVRPGESGVVRIKGSIQVKSPGEEARVAGQLHNLETNPPVRQEGNHLWVGNFDEAKVPENPSINYEIETPAETRLTAHSTSGDQWIEGIRGPASIKSESGDIRITAVHGVIAIETDSGDVRLEKSGAGAINIDTSSGDVAFGAPNEEGFDISARSNSGEISINPGFQVESRTGKELRAKVRGGGSAVAIQTSSGDIRID